MHVSGFSVVVPTHGRLSEVLNLIKSLNSAAKHFDGVIEIIIVDSSPKLDSDELLKICNEWKCKYIKAENKVAIKRNIGIKNATQDFIFFTDSDCEVTPNVFQEHSRVYELDGHNIIGVLGLTKWFGEKGSLWKYLEFSSSFTAAFNFASWLDNVPWGTCTNLSVRKKTIINIGGFDENLPCKVYGEDVDFGLRLTQNGGIIRCNSKAVVNHNRKYLNKLRQGLRKSFHSGIADYYLGEKHDKRLIIEFPGQLFTIIVISGVYLSRFVYTTTHFSALVIFVLPFYFLMQAVINMMNDNGDIRSLSHRIGAILLDLFFEAGILYSSIRNFSINRLFKKFIYINEQLLAERKKKIVQFWALLFSILFLILFI